LSAEAQGVVGRKEVREMRKRKVFLVASLVLLLLGMGAWGCGPPPPPPEGPTVTCTPTGKSETICDGIDDDCDKETDEDYQPSRCGIGACERPSQCVEGAESCTPGPGQPEICDNRIDDDCDGLVDTEDPDCPPPDQVISCEEAIDYVGEKKTVEGIFYVVYKPKVRGKPTFMNCPRPYQSHDFTALIWGENRQKFIDCLGGAAEDMLDQHELRVSGLIELYKGKPEIILTECGQLTVIQ